MKRVLFLVIILISVFIFGCSSSSNSDKSESVKTSITAEDIENVKKISDITVYNEIKSRYDMDDKDMVLYYRKVQKLNNEYITRDVLEEYDKPYLQAMYYCDNFVVKSTDAANKHLDVQFTKDDKTKSALKNCSYKMKVINNSSSYDIKPRVFFIARDRLTKLPVFAGSLDFDEIKREKDKEENISMPLSECEIIPASVYAVPQKLVVHGFGIFWSTILDRYPDKRFAEENSVNVPAVVTGTIIGDDVKKLIGPGDSSERKWTNGASNYCRFQKGTRVVVRFGMDGYCLVSDALGGYVFVKESDLQIDNQQELLKGELAGLLIMRVPNKSIYGNKVYIK